MDILMLGDSAVGKTTFMMSTYGLMCDNGIGGFKVKCTNPIIHDWLISAYNDFRANGKYPAASVKMDSYKYSFFCESQWIMDFTLTDIRGESIRDYDITELAAAIRKADVILLFLNGYDIIRGKDMDDALFDLYVVLNNSIEVNRNILLMPIFTQMDRCNGLPENWYTVLKRPVQQLWEIVQNNDKLLIQLAPIACTPDCMMDLDFVMVTMIMFGYRREFRQYVADLEKEKASIERQIGNGVWPSFTDFLGVKDERDKRRKRLEELRTKIPILEQMQAKYDKLRLFYNQYKFGTSYKLRGSSCIKQ